MLLLLLTLGAAAQEKDTQLFFQTDPPGAKVYFENSSENTKRANLGKELLSAGKSNEPIFVESKLFKSGDLVVTFRREGYLKHTQTFSIGNHLRNPDPTRAISLPREGPLNLTPRWHLYLVLAGSLAAVALALAAFFGYQRRKLSTVDIREWVQQRTVSGPAEDPLLGRQLGGYWVLERLGHGGMATVYRGDRGPESGETAAIKVIHTHVAENEEFKQRFDREIKIGGRLLHPHIVNVFEGGETEGRLYLAMELLEGGSLADRLKGPMPLDEALVYLEPLFEAVARAHDRGVIHRDLKPENVLFDKNDRLKVADFGLARTHDASTLTVSGNVMGTPAYMAPEQIQEVPEEASDQYALGVITYEMLAGRRPFEAEEPIQLLMKHLSETPAPPTERPELNGVVLKMLAKTPGERYANVLEALAELKKLGPV